MNYLNMAINYNKNLMKLYKGGTANANNIKIRQNDG